MTEESWLLEAEPYDPLTAAVAPVYLAKRTTFFGAADAAAPDRTYRGWLTQALSTTRSMFDGGLAGGIGGNSLPSIAAAALTVGDEFAAERVKFKRYRWAGRAVRIFQGVRGQPRSAYVQRFDGYVAAQPAFETGRVAIPLGDLQAKFDAPFQAATYAGTGGFAGGTDLKGQHKPDGVGVVRAAPVTWVDQNAGWADVCASGFHTVYAVRDGGNPLVEDAGNPPAAGKYYVDKPNGRLRFGSLPTFGYTVDFRSSFGGNATTVGAICAAAATSRLGFAAGQVDAAGFAGVDTARPWAAGFMALNGTTHREMWDYLLGGALCFYTTTPTGLLTAGAVKAPAATGRTHPSVSRVITDRDIVPGTFKRAAFAAPPHTINVLARRNWTPLTDDRLAALAPQADKDFARQAWRTVPKANAATAAEFPLSVPLEWPSPFDDLTDAGLFGDIARDLLTVPRAPAEATLAIAPFGVKLGDEVWIESAVNEVNAPAIVARVDENEAEHRVRLGLYALTE
ncbi:MAG: hypothetical protein SFV21_00250 [Rhodospirillaceae bacterium]|nr:hypothetical protein [Rhodospirillaceae bacterium]